MPSSRRPSAIRGRRASRSRRIRIRRTGLRADRLYRTGSDALGAAAAGAGRHGRHEPQSSDATPTAHRHERRHVLLPAEVPMRTRTAQLGTLTLAICLGAAANVTAPTSVSSIFRGCSPFIRYTRSSTRTIARSRRLRGTGAVPGLAGPGRARRRRGDRAAARRCAGAEPGAAHRIRRRCALPRSRGPRADLRRRVALPRRRRHGRLCGRAGPRDRSQHKRLRELDRCADRACIRGAAAASCAKRSWRWRTISRSATRGRG